MSDLRDLLGDALHEFAGHREQGRAYVDKRYPASTYTWMSDEARERKIEQVLRRAKLARKLHHAVFGLEVAPYTLDAPMPIYEYYKMCPTADLVAMSRSLDLLPASTHGTREGWMVKHEGGVLVIEGPNRQRAFWQEDGQRWLWIEGAAS